MPHAGSGEFHPRDWNDVRAFEESVWVDDGRGRYLTAIIDSVIATGLGDVLAVSTSVHDLLVVSAPVPVGPMDVLAVRAPTSLRPPGQNCVLIEFMAVSGRNTSIEKPEGDAVPLFWRFVKEEFGIAPER